MWFAPLSGKRSAAAVTASLVLKQLPVVLLPAKATTSNFAE